MKLLHQFTDSRNNITNKIFETEYGPKLVHSINPSTSEFATSFVFHAGSNIEHQLNLPSGTAHFAEHILAGNPNKKFKSYEEREQFRGGTSKRPKIYANAFTSKHYISFVAVGNDHNTLRYLEYIQANLDYPLENIEKYIEKERGIILAEKSRKRKDEKNPAIPFAKTMFPNSKFLHQYNIGTANSIKKISVKDLKKYIKHSITLSNLVIGIQSNRDLSEKEIEKIDNILKFLPEGNIFDLPQTKELTESSWDFFQMDDKEGTEFCFNMTQDKIIKIDYKDMMIRNFLRNLFSKEAHRILREQKSLIYGVSSEWISSLSYNHNVRGWIYSLSHEKIGDFLEEYAIFLEKDFPEFLHTERAKELFEDIKSSYIYPLTESYNRFYMENIIHDIIEGRDIYEFDKAKEVAENLTLQELIDYLPNFFIYKPTKIWIESSLERKDIEDIVENSNTLKYYKSLPTTTS